MNKLQYEQFRCSKKPKKIRQYLAEEPASAETASRFLFSSPEITFNLPCFGGSEIAGVTTKADSAFGELAKSFQAFPCFPPTEIIKGGLGGFARFPKANIHRKHGKGTK